MYTLWESYLLPYTNLRWLQTLLDSVKANILSMADQIQRANAQCTIRIAFVGYNDDDCRAPPPFQDFTEDMQSFREWLGKVELAGGCDTAEDIFSGLQAAGRLQWRSCNRVLVHIADHPCHGAEFHDFGHDVRHDRYSAGDKQGRKADVLLRHLAEGCKLDVYLFCHLTEHTKTMLKRFHELLGATFRHVQNLPRDVYMSWDTSDVL